MPDLQALGQARRDSIAALKAGVLEALAAGMSEQEAARRAGVDRMTVRAWAGKPRKSRPKGIAA